MSDAAEVVIDTIGGRTFRASRRTWAHLDYTVAALPPDCSLRVIQGCYNSTVAASAGTHDKDACLDVQIIGMSWAGAQRFLREHGWAAWYRYPPMFSEHIHMVSIGYPGGPSAVGVYVPGQVADYYAHRSGLAGHLADPTWHPADIASTVFDYDSWNEAHMPLNKDDLAQVRSIVAEEFTKALNAPVVDVGKGRKFSIVTVLSNLRTLVKG